MNGEPNLGRGAWLVRLEAPRFVAGLVCVDGEIERCAPMLGYMRRHHWTATRVVATARRNGWHVTLHHLNGADREALAVGKP